MTQLRATPPAVVHFSAFFVQPGEGLTSKIGSFVLEGCIVLLRHEFSNLLLLLVATLEPSVRFAYYVYNKCMLLARQCHQQRRKRTTKVDFCLIFSIISCDVISYNAKSLLLKPVQAIFFPNFCSLRAEKVVGNNSSLILSQLNDPTERAPDRGLPASPAVAGSIVGLCRREEGNT